MRDASRCTGGRWRFAGKFLGEQHPDYAVSLNSLAALYHAMGDYARAEPLYRQAREIRRKVLGEQHPDYAESLSNLAALYRETADFAQAESLYRQALEIHRVLGEQHPDYATSLSSLASLYGEMRDYARAEPLFRQALEILRQVVGEQHPDYALSLNNSAALYYMMGDFARAEPLLQQALEIREQVLGDQHPAYAESLNNLAALYLAKGDLARAEPLYRQALEIVTVLVEATATVQDETGQLALGRSVQFYLDNYLSTLAGRRERAATMYQAVFSWKGATLVRQRAARLAAGDPQLAAVLAELQSVVRQWSALAAASDPAAKKRLEELAARKEQLESEMSRGSAAYRAAAAEVDVAALQTALPEKSALVDYFEFWLSEPSKEKPGQLNRRRSLLAFVVRPDGEVQMFDLGEAAPIHAAIETWRQDFGASPEAQAAGVLLRQKLWDPLVEAIGDADLVLVSPDGTLGKLPFAALPGAKPDTFLIEEVAMALIPVPRLIPALVEDAERRELPRELLVLGGVDYDRRAAAEITAVAADGPRRPWERSVSRAVAQQEVTEGISWAALPGTESEAAFIAGLYQRLMGLPAGSEQIVHLRGAEASEDAFRAAAPECYLLHLATHGFFATADKPSALATDDAQRDSLRNNPFGDRLAAVGGYSPGLLSGLVLAGANVALEIPDDPAELAELPDDGILTAEEIAFLPLGGAQLVVLSACETGLGKVAGGEGLLGVQRAFQVAGARTTIATLWKVSDEATRRIVEEFYLNYLEREMPPLEALRAAQLWALNNPDLMPRAAELVGEESQEGARLSPYYWAAFTLSGDWR
jgi:CHAT domain-containing protein/Tfp pilus assembly protein PilF